MKHPAILALSAFFGALVVLLVVPLLLFSWSEPPNVRSDIFHYLKTNDTLSIPLSVLAKHPVTSACRVEEYRPVNDVAGLFGFDVPGTIDEGNVGILMMNDRQAKAVQTWASEVLYQPPCLQGKNIQLKLEAIVPADNWKDRLVATEAVKFHMRGSRLVSD